MAEVVSGERVTMEVCCDNIQMDNGWRSEYSINIADEARICKFRKIVDQLEIRN